MKIIFSSRAALVFTMLVLLVCGTLLGFSMGLKQGEASCQRIEIDPVAAFILSQPDVAIDMTGVPADKTPDPWLLKKGWDEI